MGKLLSKPEKKKSRITDADMSILTLKQQRDQIVIFRKKLESQYKYAEDSAKVFLAEEKRTLALLALKRRKQQGELIHQAEEQLLQINGLISNVEMAVVQAEVVKAIETGTEALRKMQEEVNLQYVEKLMDSNAELQDEVRDIGEMLAGIQRDEKDVYDEYARLEELVAQEKSASIPVVPQTSVETTEIVPDVQIKAETSIAPRAQMVRTVAEFEEQ